IEVSLAREGETLVYEFKLPLEAMEAHPHALGVKAGAVVGVGFESPEIDPEQMAQMQERGGRRRHGGPGGPDGGVGGPGGPSGVPGGGMGGGRHGGGWGGRGGFGGGMPQPIDFWAKLQLAEH